MRRRETAALSERTVARILEDQFPALGIVQASAFGEGSDSSAFEVNRRWIFRFPKRAEVERQLLVEMDAVRMLRPRLPLPVPAYEFRGRPSTHFRWHFGGYEKLSGEPAIRIDVRAVRFTSVARAMGRFLSKLHATSSAEAARLSVPRQSVGSAIDDARTEALGNLRRLSTLVDVPVDRLYEQLKDRPRVPSRSRSGLAVVHNDLGAEHILLHPRTGKVTGIIDWGDIAIGDPAVDFSGLFHWAGEGFVHAVLRHYSGLADAALVSRARYLAACKGVNDIAFGHDMKQPEYIAAGLRGLQLTIDRAS